MAETKSLVRAFKGSLKDLLKRRHVSPKTSEKTRIRKQIQKFESIGQIEFTARKMLQERSARSNNRIRIPGRQER